MALWVLPHCWVHLVGVLGGVKLYSESITIINIYPTLSTAVGRREGMDCNWCLRMTCSINRIPHQSQRLGVVLVTGDVWLRYIHIMSSYNITIPITPFTMPQGRQEWVDGHGWLWMTSFVILSIILSHCSCISWVGNDATMPSFFRKVLISHR